MKAISTMIPEYYTYNHAKDLAIIGNTGLSFFYIQFKQIGKNS